MDINDLKIGYLVMHDGKRCSIEQITSAEYMLKNSSANALVLGVQTEDGRGLPVDFIEIRGNATESIAPILVDSESVIYVGLIKTSQSECTFTLSGETIFGCNSFFRTFDGRITVVITKIGTSVYQHNTADILYLDGQVKKVQYLHELQQELTNYYKKDAKA